MKDHVKTKKVHEQDWDGNHGNNIICSILYKHIADRC